MTSLGVARGVARWPCRTKCIDVRLLVRSLGQRRDVKGKGGQNGPYASPQARWSAALLQVTVIKGRAFIGELADARTRSSPPGSFGVDLQFNRQVSEAIPILEDCAIACPLDGCFAGEVKISLVLRMRR